LFVGANQQQADIIRCKLLEQALETAQRLKCSRAVRHQQLHMRRALATNAAGDRIDRIIGRDRD
jgi:hypothetical protein